MYFEDARNEFRVLSSLDARNIDVPRARCHWNMKSLLFFHPTARTTPITMNMFPVPISVLRFAKRDHTVRARFCDARKRSVGEAYLFKNSMKPRKEKRTPSRINANPATYIYVRFDTQEWLTRSSNYRVRKTPFLLILRTNGPLTYLSWLGNQVGTQHMLRQLCVQRESRT
jgi:hypothetical protein